MNSKHVYPKILCQQILYNNLVTTLPRRAGQEIQSSSSFFIESEDKLIKVWRSSINLLSYSYILSYILLSYSYINQPVGIIGANRGRDRKPCYKVVTELLQVAISCYRL